MFKYLGGVDATALCISRTEPEDIVAFVETISPSFGGVNLEDISAPKCFRILEALRASAPIPVWHDDQQGTAAAAVAGLICALRVVGKAITEIRIALVGVGAANTAVYCLLKAAGVDPSRIRVCDSHGMLHADRHDIAEDRARLHEKWMICTETNPDRLTGGIEAALAGADACLAFSAPGPDVISPDAVAGMAKDAIVFACANPTPEIWPDLAKEAGARIVATGRSDFPNQVNNALIFPGLFRGVLDIRARRITDQVALAAAHALVMWSTELGLDEEHLLPRLDDMTAAAAVAAAAARSAQAEGIAEVVRSSEQVFQDTLARIAAARENTSRCTDTR